jgi:hypothetical protein
VTVDCGGGSMFWHALRARYGVTLIGGTGAVTWSSRRAWLDGCADDHQVPSNAVMPCATSWGPV